MKLIQLFTLIAGVLSATTIQANVSQCTCSQIQYQADCLAVNIPNANSSLPDQTCTWTPNPNSTAKQAKGACSITTTTAPVSVNPIATYCSNISVTSCAATLGCALPDAKTCIAFTGCSAYVFTTDAACQKVSTQCTTDGTQCSTRQPCSQYTPNLNKCGLYSSSSGTGKCKISGTSCVDQVCSDAPNTLSTDTQCNGFLQGCVSSGAGCIQNHLSCASQAGTAVTCLTLVGTEGQCKYSGTGTACAARTCADAPTTYNTVSQCTGFMPSCIYTIGKGCSSSIMMCTQLSFELGCSNLTNTGGVQCTNNTIANPTSCRELACSDNITATTNSACQTFLPNGNCVTNSLGCVASSNYQCSSYTGTNTQCSQYTGSGGPCKGNAANSSTSQACIPKSCGDAPTSSNTNKACQLIQSNCVTTGYGCIASANLSICATYTPTTSTPCDGYIGSDGPCTLATSTSTNCTARTCAGASNSQNMLGIATSTNTGCQSWFPAGIYGLQTLYGCVTNGSVCIQGGSCTTLSQTSCIGYNNCSFTSSCVQNTACSYYSNQSMCNSNTAMYGKYTRQCVWNSSCSASPCPTSGSNDSSCSVIGTVQGCFYQGSGTTCIDIASAPNCGQFIGDNSFNTNQGCAMLFASSCASSNSLSSTPAACVTRTCLNFYASTVNLTTNNICGQWLTGCISNASTGCLTQFKQAAFGVSPPYAADLDICSNYLGTATTCAAIIANNNPVTKSGVQCWSTSASVAPCIVKTVNNILQSSVNQIWTDLACQTQLAGTVSTQVSVAVGQPGVCALIQSCSSYIGTYSFCSSITGTGGKCTKLSGFCYPKLVQNCTSLVGTYIGQCQKYSNTCTWVSTNNCSTVGSCLSYLGTALNCNAVSDAYGLPCGSNNLNNTSASGAACIQWCTDYNTGPNPTASIAYCQKIKDAIGNPCTASNNSDATCSFATQVNYVLGVGQCSNALSTVRNGKCTPIQTTNACAQYLKTNVTDCAAQSASCTYVSGVTCISITFCSFTSPTFNSANACAAISSLCTYIPGTGCSLIQGCANYSIPASYSSNAQMMQFCIGLSNGTNNCLYNSANTGVCSNGASGACSSYTNSSTSLTLTVALCLQFQNASKSPCGFTSAGTNCVDPISCSTIAASGVTLVDALKCSAQIDQSTFTPCSVTSSQTTCQPGQSNCTAYKTINTNNTDNAAQCQSYFIAGGQKCGYISGLTCSNRTCSDLGVSQTNCNSYIGLTCVWTGSLCVNASTIITCSQIQGSSTTACSIYTDKFGRQCWWTSSTQCSDYQCSSQQTASTATHVLCQNLNPGCTVLSPTGNTCQTVRPSCFSYTPTTISDCAFMYDSANIPCVAGSSTRCTYATSLPPAGSVTQQNCLINPAYVFTAGTTAVQNTCTGASTIVTCSTKSVAPNQSFQQNVSYCQSLTSVVYGTPCFFSQFTTAGVPSTTCLDSVLSLNTPNCPAANLFNGTSTTGSGSDADCAAFSTGCTSTIASATASSVQTSCSNISCSLAPSSTTQLGCTSWNSSCVWNGSTGCVQNTTQCTALFGTVTTCALLNGGYGSATYAPCFQSTITSTTTPAACSYATCSNAPSSIIDNAGCELWWPSKYNVNYNSPTQVNLNCVWNGSTGCVSPQQCNQFTGNATVCSLLTATDGPCKYISGSSCTPVLCTDAPNNYATDAQCSFFANSSQQCITTGYGCINRANLISCSQIVNQNSCTNSLLAGVAPYSKNCAWLPTCVASVTSCTDSSLTNATLCTTTPIQGQTCVWNGNSCQAMTCIFLPSTLTNHAACVAALPLGNCTTSGAGCVPLGSCSSYTQFGSSTCEAATNQELPSNPQTTKCIWATNQCRAIKCTDNTTATTNELCNQNSLTGCLTTALGCVQIGSFQCSNLITAAACIVDGQGGPCLWISNSCQSYTGCSSISYSTHAQCQKIIVGSSMSQCTSNGVNCIALTSCANYISNSISCVISNQGNICGLLPANSKGNTNAYCQTFTTCTDAQGTTNDQCALYGSSCISNGVSCQTLSTCNSYTQSACQNNQGTDGKCFFVAVSATVTTGICRTQRCSDANLTNNSAGTQTDSACAAFPAPFINQCTTNGTNCIPRSSCSSYSTQLGCAMGTDGACIWIPNNTLGPTTGNSTRGNTTTGNSTAGNSTTGNSTTPTGTCRVQQCSDAIYPTNLACAVAIISSPSKTTSTGGVVTTTPQTWSACVSNGVTCIPRSTCSSYTSYQACQGGGTEGSCAFNNGTCTQMTSCSSANSDQIACSKAFDRCVWNSAINNNTTTCTPITCVQAAAGGICRPVPAFNYLTYQVCAPASAQNSACISADSSTNPAISCFSGSFGQSTWNDTAQDCTWCLSTTNNNDVNNTNTTQTSFSTILFFYGAILSVI